MRTSFFYQCLFSKLTANPFLADNELEGIIIKNVTQLEVIGAKDCLTLIENAFRSNGIGGNTSVYEDSSLVIQFEMIKVCDFLQWGDLSGSSNNLLSAAEVEA